MAANPDLRAWNGMTAESVDLRRKERAGEERATHGQICLRAGKLPRWVGKLYFGDLTLHQLHHALQKQESFFSGLPSAKDPQKPLLSPPTQVTIPDAQPTNPLNWENAPSAASQ